MASKIYDDWELQKVVEFEGNIDQLNDKYPIECIRKNNPGYRVSYPGNDKVAVILYDNSGKKISGVIYNTERSKSDFGALIKGESLDEVLKTDPDGEYLFLYTGKNDTPKASSHYTNDGYLISIEYDDFNTVISISEELI